ncbi:hypothetical protein ES707_13726 [subsurface metagenome]
MKIFEYSEQDLYEVMKREGDKRFGSDCKHENIKNGVCVDCLRKVIK